MSAESGASDQIQGVVDALAAQIGRSVAVDDPDLHLLAHSAHVGDEDEARIASLVTRAVSPERTEWARRMGAFRATGVLRLPDAPELGVRARVVVPVRVDHDLVAIVWLIDDGTVSEQDLAATEEAADRIGVILARRALAAADERREVAELLLTVLGGEPAASREAADELLGLGVLGHAERFAAVVVRLPPDQRAPERALPPRLAERAVSALATGVAYAATDDAAVLAVGSAGPASRHPELAAALRRQLQGPDAERALIGIGGEVDRLADLATSHDQARAAVRVAASGGELTRIWGDSDRDDLLAVLLPRTLPAHLVPAVLREALAAQSEETMEAVRTVLEEAGNVARAGARLHLHRATVYYRLSRFTAATGLDLEDGATRLLLQLWFEAQRFVAVR